MCFSAAASFTAGTILLGIGTLTLKSARRPRELPLAAIPLLFAIQQLGEGVIWLTFRYGAPQLNVVMTYVYSFFSHVLWPVYVPVAVLLMEPSERRDERCSCSSRRASRWVRTCCISWSPFRSSRGQSGRTSSMSRRISLPW